jgi:transcriptional regulator with XRE-family HTH domain
MTYRELASSSGISLSALVQLEDGTLSPTVEMLRTLERILDASFISQGA